MNGGNYLNEREILMSWVITIQYERNVTAKKTGKGFDCGKYDH